MTLDITNCHAGGLDISEECGSCKHHGAAYAEHASTVSSHIPNTKYDAFADGATIVSVPITTTERCCIVVNAAMISMSSYAVTHFEIERPIGTIRTIQEDDVITDVLKLFHHAAWEVLDPGTYTYYLVNHGGASRSIHAAWIKAVASDCLG